MHGDCRGSSSGVCVEGGAFCVHLALQARSCSSQAGDIAFPVATLNNKSIEMLLSPLYHCTPSPDKSRYTHSSQEALAAREYELKAQGTQLSGEVERLRREQAATVGRLDAAGAELAEVRAALAKRERELSDFQQVRRRSGGRSGGWRREEGINGNVDSPSQSRQDTCLDCSPLLPSPFLFCLFCLLPPSRMLPLPLA